MNFSDKTVGGFPVRILCTDAGGTMPVVGIVTVASVEHLLRWTPEGRTSLVRGNMYDLVPVLRSATRDVLCTASAARINLLGFNITK